jgi:hypothetical protein
MKKQYPILTLSQLVNRGFLFLALVVLVPVGFKFDKYIDITYCKNRVVVTFGSHQPYLDIAKACQKDTISVRSKFSSDSDKYIARENQNF